MKKARLALHSAAIFGAGLCWAPHFSYAATTFVGNDGNGIAWGNPYDKIASVVVTTGYGDIQMNSTPPPADSMTAPTVFFEINLNPGTAGNPTNIESSDQWYAHYEIGMETVPGAGATFLDDPYGEPIGISTGMNYWIAAYNTQQQYPTAMFGDNVVYNYSSGAWTQVAGGGQEPYFATSTVIEPTSITVGIPLVDLGLGVGNTFNFDAYTDYAIPGGQSAYDVLDNPSFPAVGYVPWENTPYDSATAPGSTYSTTTYTLQTPTLSWNSTGAAPGYGDGVTWDINDFNNWNWNNGIFADYYEDGSNVVFNDTFGGTTSPSVTLNTTVSPGSVTVSANSTNYTIASTKTGIPGTPMGLIVDTGSFVKSGAGTLTLGVGLTAANLTISAGEIILATNTTLGSGPGGLPTSNVNISSLSIGANAVLDITNNHIIIDYSVGDPMSTLYNYLQSGFNNGGWNGTSGIISSTAQAPTDGLRYGIGWSDGGDGTHAVTGLISGEIELKYTLLGDANLDGTVNGSDFSILAANFGLGVTNWDQGNFLYGSSVNGSDFSALAANFGQGDSGAAITTAEIAALDAFAAANGLAMPSFAPVPEPAMIGLLATSAYGLLARRRR
jgi:hypothetical protein